MMVVIAVVTMVVSYDDHYDIEVDTKEYYDDG